MADFERRQLEIGLEFMRWSFAKRHKFSEGSYEAKKDAQVIRVRGSGSPYIIFISIRYVTLDRYTVESG